MPQPRQNRDLDSVWQANRGIRPAIIDRATDELGFLLVRNLHLSDYDVTGLTYRRQGLDFSFDR
jgi:hypothetical protein